MQEAPYVYHALHGIQILTSELSWFDEQRQREENNCSAVAVLVIIVKWNTSEGVCQPHWTHFWQSYSHLMHRQWSLAVTFVVPAKPVLIASDSNSTGHKGLSNLIYPMITLHFYVNWINWTSCDMQLLGSLHSLATPWMHKFKMWAEQWTYSWLLLHESGLHYSAHCSYLMLHHRLGQCSE